MKINKNVMAFMVLSSLTYGILTIIERKIKKK